MDATEDDLIMCEYNSCKIIWFHFKCMCIKKYLKGNGFVQNQEKRKIIQKEKFETFLWFNLLRSDPTK